jgi:putative PIN family toxin of toxin-antitoxin system
MKVVLDTNIIVSGLLSPFGAAGEIMRMVSSGDLRLCFDARILDEYKTVLKRPKFAFNCSHVDCLLEYIERIGEVTAGNPLSLKLRDPDDEPFLESAVSGKAKYLITRNIKHYPKEQIQGVVVITPEKFLNHYRQIVKK